MKATMKATMKEIIEEGLRGLAEEKTQATLGDRTLYLGASEIGGCPRKVVLEKLNPSKPDLQTLIRFERGHLAEEIIAQAMAFMGYRFEQQVEVKSDDEVPVKAHIDFVFSSEKSKVKNVLEVKTVSKLPSEPYSSWETQLFVQMGLLQKDYPEHVIRGGIIAMDVTAGEICFFDGYQPEETLLAALMVRAKSIWSDYQAMLNESEPAMKMEVSPLCAYCHHMKSCPKFASEEVFELHSFAENLVHLQKEEKELKGHIDHHKKMFLEMVEEKGGAITSGNCYFNKITRTRKSLDQKAIEEFLTSSGSSLEEFQKETKYSFLEVKPMKR